MERVVRTVDPSVPVARLREMDEVFAESIRRPRLLAQLLGGFGGLALLLAAIGTYGVLSYMVTERRREIGVRMALGAGRSRVLGLVMRHGFGIAASGIVAGVAGALALGRSFESLLFGVDAISCDDGRSGDDDWRRGCGCLRHPRVARVAAAADGGHSGRPESMWRAASVKVRQIVKGLRTGSRPGADVGTLVGDVASAVHDAVSFPDAVDVALATLRDRLGATVILLLEKRDAEYRCPDFGIPADGVLVNRLRHYPHPLPLEAGDFPAWRHWACEAQPQHVPEIDALAATGARVAVPLEPRTSSPGFSCLAPRVVVRPLTRRSGPS